jgi:D-inositol-3-phosphate glycosyltransferase
MRLAFLCSSSSWGGLELNNLKLYVWLRERGHEPILLGLRQSRLGQEAIKNNIPVIEFGHRRKHLALGASRRLAKIIDHHNLHVLIIAHYRQFYLCVWAKRLANTHPRLVYWQQMQVVLKRKDFYHAFFYRQLDAWIAPLHYLKDQLLSNTVLPAEKIHVIPLGVELSLFWNAAHQREKARTLFGLPQGEFLAGIIGRIDKEKGQETLLRAIHQLKNRNISAKAVIIGEETIGGEGYLAVLKSLTASLGLENDVYFRPFTRDAPMAFACLNVFVMASVSEPIGMVTVEAMAAGIPVVGTNRGGTPELLDRGNAGLLFEPGDFIQLSEHLLSLSLEKIEAFTQRAQEGSQRYSHTAQCALLETLLTPYTLT